MEPHTGNVCGQLNYEFEIVVLKAKVLNQNFWLRKQNEYNIFNI